ncbi:Rieske 2Fe-2S domain-containing protein [Azospirillum sp. RWY-5-1]|uniref:Rieske 2Fe-2S domain-containing protein n=1 Tax=Azospirillum oleiclasticum TaxID=2735135 RepID=A0ABX2TGX1_9PROT|nr:Rieske 2Fe-2S domain-containing protein [Azospirillum oleiclasticum]NYZ15513.1 Rieske 2Fe-2S domain-containing protein [Azospirillum oleiclasticum]NYZ22536.1 Rieske 2Fe-2S domain-containing protein [Azospirillum oleiclasticum]
MDGLMPPPARPRPAFTDEELRTLVRPDRVHRSLYTDPGIFDLEMERLFGRAWIFVGHASQVPNPHDYITTRIGREPVIMTRDAKGAIHVLSNRCAHRGVSVCATDSGNTRHFKCPYHGWTYRSDGTLASLPQRRSYPHDRAEIESWMSLARAARVDEYRGFVFASLTEEGPDLETYLNGIRHSIDDLVDRAPDGEVAFVGGCSRYIIRANWKLQIDNGVDLHHATYTHVSTLDDDGRQFSRHGGGPRIMVDGKKSIDWEPFGVVGFPYGHGYQGRPPVETLPSGPVYEEYVRRLEARHGVDRTRQILNYDRFNSVIWPSMTFQAFGQHIRVVRPISVDRTEINVFPVALKGAPEAYNTGAIRSLAATHSAASMIQTDDIEVFERAQAGLQSGAHDWVLFAGHPGSEEPWHEGGWRGQGTSEFVSRIQYAENWISFLCGGNGNERG